MKKSRKRRGCPPRRRFSQTRHSACGRGAGASQIRVDKVAFALLRGFKRSARSYLDVLRGLLLAPRRVDFPQKRRSKRYCGRRAAVSRPGYRKSVSESTAATGKSRPDRGKAWGRAGRDEDRGERSGGGSAERSYGRWLSSQRFLRLLLRPLRRQRLPALLLQRGGGCVCCCAPQRASEDGFLFAVEAACGHNKRGGSKR